MNFFELFDLINILDKAKSEDDRKRTKNPKKLE